MTVNAATGYVRGAPIVVIGSGLAGLFVALEARALGQVTVLTKGGIEDCNTRWAQGGIAAAVGETDSPQKHLADTIAAGAGLVDVEAARILCEEAPGRIRDLVTYGVEFDGHEGRVSLGLEAAHGAARILHAGGDRTGAAIEGALAGASRERGVTVEEFAHVTRLLRGGGGVRGVEWIDGRTGARRTMEAGAVVLATGGAGQLYSHTTNPGVATGEGMALAFMAGAELADLEFYQFHPTAFRRAGWDPFLISEAVRGDGAVLRNVAGESFMSRYHPQAELAPRDVVARAMVAEMRREASDHVLLDCTAMRDVDLAVRFPGVYAFCKRAGIDMATEGIPVAPAAHYMMGGVRTDTWGRTTVPGLYACGEVACTGVHGANRLASNSLMEAAVFGKRVVEGLAAGRTGAAETSGEAVTIGVEEGALSREEIQRVMWRGVGIERDAEGLGEARAALGGGTGEKGTAVEQHETAQMRVAAVLMTEAALRRTESRGAHYRSDFPVRDDTKWARRQVFRHVD